MQRIGPRPFGGVFDGIPYDHPAFVPWLSLTCVLIAVVIATQLALRSYRRPRPLRRRRDERRRGFTIVTPPAPAPPPRPTRPSS